MDDNKVCHCGCLRNDTDATGSLLVDRYHVGNINQINLCIMGTASFAQIDAMLYLTAEHSATGIAAGKTWTNKKFQGTVADILSQMAQ
jgi:hypothetical protein